MISAKQLFDTLTSTVKANITYIDKVVVICSGRIENVQVNAIKQCMKWLSYNNHKDKFCFIYNKSDGLNATERLENLTYMCDVLGADLTWTVEYEKNDQQYKLQMNHALGFPRQAQYEDVKRDYAKLISATLTNSADDRILVEKTSCVIL